jgi:hypothetical protein
MLTDAEQEALAHKLAEVYQTAQRYAYTRDMQAVGLTPHIEESLKSRAGDLLTWGRAQVSSIVTTFQGLVSTFVGGMPAETPADAVTSQMDSWMGRYADYKAPQVANATWGTGANDGTMAAMQDVLDAAPDEYDDPDQTQKYPVAGRVRVQVTPGDSSSDYCRLYAGQDYSIAEYQALGVSFPAHPSCIHSIELFVGEGDDA